MLLMLLTKQQALEELPQCSAIIRNATFIERYDNKYNIHENVTDKVVSEQGWEVRTNLWTITKQENMLVSHLTECPF